MNGAWRRTRIVLAVLLTSALALGLSLALPGCGSKYQGTASLRAGVEKDLNELSPYYVARGQGYFTSDGLKIDQSFYTAGALAIPDLVAGKVDVAFASDYATVSKIFNNNNKLRVLASVSLTNINTFVGLRNHGISKPADLRGKTIAVSRGTAGEYGLGRFLANNDIPLSQVQIINTAPDQVPAALASGRIDAAVTWTPFLFEIEKQQGSNLIEWPETSVPDWYFLAVSTTDAIARKRDALVRLLDGLNRAEALINGSPAKAKATVAGQTTLPVSYISTKWKTSIFRLALPQELVTAMEQEARWEIDNGLTQTTAVPDYLDYMDASILKAVDPAAVEIYR